MDWQNNTMIIYLAVALSLVMLLRPFLFQRRSKKGCAGCKSGCETIPAPSRQ